MELREGGHSAMTVLNYLREEKGKGTEVHLKHDMICVTHFTNTLCMRISD